MVCAIDGDVEAEKDAKKVDVMRIALIMGIKVVFFMIIFLQIYHGLGLKLSQNNELFALVFTSDSVDRHDNVNVA